MGIFQFYKWDAIRREELEKRRPLTEVEYKTALDNFSDLSWGDFSSKADQTLAEYRGNEQKWLVPIAQGVISAFLYSVLLVIVLVIIRMNDIDVLHALRIDANPGKEQPAANGPAGSTPQKASH
jgi:hypothetical protein